MLEMILTLLNHFPTLIKLHSMGVNIEYVSYVLSSSISTLLLSWGVYKYRKHMSLSPGAQLRANRGRYVPC